MIRRGPVVPLCLAGVACLIGMACLVGLAQVPARAQEYLPGEASGGEAGTVRKANRTAFAQPVSGLTPKQRRMFSFGDRLFNTTWSGAPGSVPTLDGLGPLFNRPSCSGCHVRDGRGRPPIGDERDMLSMLVRLSVPGTSPVGGPNPHPVYGGQFQPKALPGVPAEGRAVLEWTEQAGTYADGTPYSLRSPQVTFEDLGYGPMGDGLMTSLRVASAVYGSGLLEQVPEEAIMALADPEDADGDGISGRPNRVWDVEAGAPALGRFGWKANQPSVRQQTADAAVNDMGLTTPVFPEHHCTDAQQACIAETAYGDQPEISEKFLAQMVFYLQSLAVPARRNVEDAQVRRGQDLFRTAECTACHVESLPTGTHPEIPQISGQTIHPYTDLLLHDMGQGLADNRPDFEASGQEWRTAPLWGLGLIPMVNKHGFYLHDGRARSLEEAILWHGGEGEAAKEAFRAMDQDDREALIAFLRSL